MIAQLYIWFEPHLLHRHLYFSANGFPFANKGISTIPPFLIQREFLHKLFVSQTCDEHTALFAQSRTNLRHVRSGQTPTVPPTRIFARHFLDHFVPCHPKQF